jgi:hypothetical protein
MAKRVAQAAIEEKNIQRVVKALTQSNPNCVIQFIRAF